MCCVCVFIHVRASVLLLLWIRSLYARSSPLLFAHHLRFPSSQPFRSGSDLDWMISEQVFHALAAGSVPVVFGSETVKQMAAFLRTGDHVTAAEVQRARKSATAPSRKSGRV